MVQTLHEHILLFQNVQLLEPDITSACAIMSKALRAGGKILIAGNGGSAADAQHFTAELVGRFQCNRKALSCIALTTDTSNLTAIANDFGYEEVFSRQVEALGRKEDVFIGISTSGNSLNIIKATDAAHTIGMTTVALLGCDGGALRTLVHHAVTVPHSVTARIQEAHIFILHYWAEILEKGCA